MNSNHFYKLPDVITQKKMPVTVNNMVTTEDLAKWPYLANVHIPTIEANVDMLIGINTPKVLEPWEVINSCGTGPYAIRTVLGWVVNGPLNGNSGTSKAEFPSVVINRISVCSLREVQTKQHIQEEVRGLMEKDLEATERLRMVLEPCAHHSEELSELKTELSFEVRESMEAAHKTELQQAMIHQSLQLEDVRLSQTNLSQDKLQLEREAALGGVQASRRERWRQVPQFKQLKYCEVPATLEEVHTPSRHGNQRLEELSRACSDMDAVGRTVEQLVSSHNAVLQEKEQHARPPEARKKNSICSKRRCIYRRQ